jgi:hypothetical protein
MSAHAYDIVQEFELHQLLVQNLECLPAEMRSRPDVAFLAWASELRLHDAGRDGGDGWADLLIVDELGKSWIIELKLSTSAELNMHVWQQVIRYRDAAMRMKWSDIHNYADRFLDGEGRVKPISDSFNNRRNLVEVIRQWQKIIGRELMPAEEIVQSIASSLKDGSVGLAVIADCYSKSAAEGLHGIQHRGDLAYISVRPNAGRLETTGCCIVTGKGPQNRKVHIDVSESFSKYHKKPKRKLTLDVFEQEINPAMLGVWREIILPSLFDLGWDGSIARPEKSMTLEVNCKGQPAAIVKIGFSGADTKGIDRKFKIPGTYGMLVDFVPWYIKCDYARPDISKQDIEAFASKLYKLGWRGSGKARAYAGVTSIPDDIYKIWSYMRYYPSSDVKDFLGRPDDHEKIAAFFEELKAFCR